MKNSSSFDQLAKFIKKQRLSFFLFFILSIPFIGCEKSPDLDETTILIVDDEKVSIDKFRDIYELDPAFPGYRKGEAGLKEYLEVLIDKFLAEELAEQEGIFDDVAYRRRLDYERKKAIIQAFYQKEISNKVTVTERELRDAYHKMGIKLQVKHLFTPEKPQAENAYQALEQGVPFDTLAITFFMNVDPEKGGADLGEIGWGELDPSLEDTLYQLKPGEYSKPVRSRWGYHILLVTNRKQEMIPSENDFQKKRSRILKKLRRRKEESEAGKYLKEYLDPFQITVKKDAFLKIIQTLGIYSENQPRIRFQKFRPFTDEHISLLKTRLSSDLDQLFMSSTQLNWSIGDFLNKVAELPVDHRPQLSTVRKFKDDVGIMIRNEYLVREAMNQDMDDSPKVDSTVKELSKEIAYRHYLKNTYKNMEVPQQVTDYFNAANSIQYKNKQIPGSILPGMTTIESYRYHYAQRELHQDLLAKFPDAGIRINDKLIEHETSKINWNNPIRMFVLPNN